MQQALRIKELCLRSAGYAKGGPSIPWTGALSPWAALCLGEQRVEESGDLEGGKCRVFFSFWSVVRVYCFFPGPWHSLSHSGWGTQHIPPLTSPRPCSHSPPPLYLLFLCEIARAWLPRPFPPSPSSRGPDNPFLHSSPSF